MTYTGRVKNGVIILDPPATLPEGCQVEVAPTNESAPTLSERLKKVIGTANGLPEDMAENHDHYIHGTAKRS